MINRRIICLLAYILLPLAGFALAASTFEVTNTSDDGDGSLRWAINSANDLDGTYPVYINFNIPTTDPGYVTETVGDWTGSFWRIKPASQLPFISRGNIVIDGSTQPGYVSGQGPVLVIDGSNLVPGTGNAGITLSSSNNTIKNLSIVNFSTNAGSGAIAVTGDSLDRRGRRREETTNNNIIQGNYLGVHPSGNTAEANSYGLALWEGSANNQIGGTAPEDRNIISGNNNLGIYLYGSPSNEVLGNYIGLNAAGTAALGNYFGIDLQSGFNQASFHNIIGGETSGARNVISGNTFGGIYLFSASSNEVKGNYIGTNADGSIPLTRQNVGLYVQQESINNIIGPNNVIAYNGSAAHLSQDSIFNRFTKNQIFGNLTSISSDNETNINIQPPVIITALADLVRGEATPEAIIELYRVETVHASGYGDANVYLGSTEADGAGAWAISGLNLSSGGYLTATATDRANNTSTFSLNKIVAASAIPTTTTTTLPTTTTTATTTTITTTIPVAASLYVYPNPYSLADTQDFILAGSLLQNNSGTIKIFDVSGRLVWSTPFDHVASVNWQAADSGGSKVPTGIYFYQVTDSAGHSEKGKIAVVK